MFEALLGNGARLRFSSANSSEGTRTKKKGRVVIKQSEALLGNGARLRFSSAKLQIIIDKNEKITLFEQKKSKKFWRFKKM